MADPIVCDKPRSFEVINTSVRSTKTGRAIKVLTLEGLDYNVELWDDNPAFGIQAEQILIISNGLLYEKEYNGKITYAAKKDTEFAISKQTQKKLDAPVAPQQTPTQPKPTTTRIDYTPILRDISNGINTLCRILSEKQGSIMPKEAVSAAVAEFVPEYEDEEGY